MANSEPPPVPEVILARGHLHPRILILRLLESIQQVAVLAVLGLAVERWFLIAGIAVFVVRLATALVVYLTLEYQLTASELRVRTGILQRQERRIPLDRIQDLGTESSLLRRALGLTVVLVETASGSGVEARLDGLRAVDASHLRAVLLAARQQRQAAQSHITGDAPPLPEPLASEPEWLVHRAAPRDLVLRGITDLRLGALAVSAFAMSEFADQFGLGDHFDRLLRALQQWFAQYSTLVMVGLLLILLLVVLAVGLVTTTIGNLLQFHDFRLTLRGDVLQKQFGLLTTRSKILPRPRIQRITVEQSWLRRLLNLCVVKADSAGGSRAQGEDNKSGWDVVAPLVDLATADAMLPALLPGLQRTASAWRRGSPRLVLRVTLQGCLLAALLTGLGTLAELPHVWLALLPVPLAGLFGLLLYRNLGFAVEPQFLALRTGVLGRVLAYLPTSKVQAVVLEQGPLAQLLGLAELTVYVAGGSPTRLRHLTVHDARAVAAEVSSAAAWAAARKN